ncbi:MAG: response regulator [Pseudomonadota bacterium]
MMNLKILIVDDDKKLLTILKSLLTEESHEVETCVNGREAVEKAKTQNFDLVITDLMMPGMSGIEVLKEIRNISPDTLVIIVTGFASIETAVQAIREGAYDYLTKPFKLDEIKIVVNNAREKIMLVRENQKLIQELQEAYTQLRMVKKIMGAETEPADRKAGNGSDPRNHQPLVAGSMLPYHYLHNRGVGQPLLPDLERLFTLRETGFLSEEEFNLCKSKLLKPLRQ